MFLQVPDVNKLQMGTAWPPETYFLLPSTVYCPPVRRCTVTSDGETGEAGEAGEAGELGDSGGRGGRGALAGSRSCSSVASGGAGLQLEVSYSI